MTVQPLTAVLQGLRQLFGTEVCADSDGQLLDRFVKSRDETAFTALLSRHGAMVWGVCRRIVRHEQDAEDAFQATFLVLARRARDLDRRDSVAGWLHTVAYHAALRTRGTTARRQQSEQPLNQEPLSPQPSVEPDLSPILEEELHRLPTRYRVPLVLCYLEGKTNEEAARQIRCPIGTVKGRLSRAREMLRTRLARRGIVISAGIVAASLTETASAVPVGLMAGSARMVLPCVGGEQSLLSSASPAVRTLTTGVLKTMLFAKIKVRALCLGVMAILCLSLGTYGYFAYSNDTRPMSGAEAEQQLNPDARLANAAVPQRKVQDGQKDEKDKRNKAMNAELQKLDGMWRLVSLEIGGNAVDPETWGRNVRREFSGTAVHFHSGTRVTRSEIRIDPSKTPGWIDETWVTGKRTHGIYERKGNTLRLFLVPADEKRPTQFKTRDGTKEAIATFERINPTVENGLSVNLLPVKQRFTEGEALQFRATFKNVSNRDLRLFDPVWYRGWDLIVNDGPWQLVSLLEAKRQPEVLVLKPGQELDVDMKFDQTFAYHWRGPQTRPVPARNNLKPGKYKLQAAIRFIKNETPGAPFWTGTIKTSPAAFEIVAQKAAAPPAASLISMVEWPGYGPNGDKQIVRFTVQPGGKFRLDNTTGILPKAEINKLREQIEKADVGPSVEDAPTLTFRWRVEAGQQQEKVFTNPKAPDRKKLVAKLKELAGKYGDAAHTIVKDGFSVRLVAEQPTFIEGEDLRFIATFKNVSDKDFRLFDHPSYYLGWEMMIEDGPWKVISLYKGKRKPKALLLKAGQGQGIQVRLGDTFAYRWDGPVKKPIPSRENLKPGKYKLRATFKCIENDSPGPPFWTGTIKTQPVAFEIVADPIPARLAQVEWGKETAGLVAKFRAVKNIVKPGEPLEFEILVKNVSKKEMTLGTLNGRLAHYTWRFQVGDWEWSSPGPSLMGMRVKPGETESVRCLVATKRDSLTDEQKRLYHAGPFRNLKTVKRTAYLPEGVYRVRAAYPTGNNTFLEPNAIEVRVSDNLKHTGGGNEQEKKSP